MQRKSAIGHTGLPFNCPHTDVIAAEVISLMDLNKQSRVLDLGCGKAELLTRIVERNECRGKGVDKNSDILNESRTAERGELELVEQDMTEFVANNEELFDAILCIGSIREGQQELTIKKLCSFLNKRSSESCSYLLVGELVWVQPLSAYFLEYLQMKESDYCTLRQLKDICESCNMEVVYSASQSLEVYESNILANIEAWALNSDNMSDPDYDTIVNRSREWHSFSREHAWNTWEFATILVRLKE